MSGSKILIYDGSFNGFLSAVYAAFEKRIQVSDIRKISHSQDGLFTETLNIRTNLDKAQKVWNGIGTKNKSAVKKCYFAFLSEYEGVEIFVVPIHHWFIQWVRT